MSEVPRGYTDEEFVPYAEVVKLREENARLRELCNRARNCLMARPRPPAVLIEQLRAELNKETKG